MFKKNDKKSIVVVLDVASASVGGMLFEKSVKSPPKILASIRQAANFSRKLSEQKLQTNLMGAVSGVLAYLKKETGKKPVSLICVFSSPWYKAQTRIIKIERKKPFLVDNDLITTLTKEEKENILRQWSVPGAEQESPVFVESEPLKAFLNGYNIENILDKKCSKMEFFLYLSIAEEKIINAIKEAASDYISPAKIKFYTFPFALLSVLKGIINTNEGGMFVDLSGELTDIFIIRNNIIEEINLLPTGQNLFIQTLSETAKISMEEAAAKLKQYEREELAQDAKVRVKQSMSAAAEKWSRSLKILLKEIAGDKYLPSVLYICGPSGRFKEITQQVVGQDFSAFTSFGRPMEIIEFSPKSIKHHFEFTKGFSNNQDIFLLISTLFANYFLTKNYA